MTPEQLHLRARRAALASHIGHPAGERTKQLRRGFEEQFIRQARELCPEADDAEIARQAAMLRKAYFARLSYAAASARARKRG
jgi:hypothetical protein